MRLNSVLWQWWDKPIWNVPGSAAQSTIVSRILDLSIAQEALLSLISQHESDDSLEGGKDEVMSFKGYVRGKKDSANEGKTIIFVGQANPD